MKSQNKRVLLNTGCFRTVLQSTAVSISLLLVPIALAEGGNNSPQVTIQNNTMTSQGAGVAINGSANNSTINSNQNTLTTGTNNNQLSSPATGGNSVLLLPRNPLPLSNAALGRSNFGVQFGVQNNPILGGLSTPGLLGGGQSALGWFAQAALTVPFGKIPDGVLNNTQSTQLDELRQKDLEDRRNIFGNLSAPTTSDDASQPYNTKVNAKVVGMGAYNYATIPSSKISLPESLENGSGITDLKVAQPKLLALTPAEVFTKPLNLGSKVGVIEAGNEYAYLGHTHSGWVKILLPNGIEGWTSSRFEYIKRDYTQIDALAVDPTMAKREKTASLLSSDKNEKMEKKTAHVQDVP